MIMKMCGDKIPEIYFTMNFFGADKFIFSGKTKDYEVYLGKCGALINDKKYDCELYYPVEPGDRITFYHDALEPLKFILDKMLPEDRREQFKSISSEIDIDKILSDYDKDKDINKVVDAIKDDPIINSLTLQWSAVTKEYITDIKLAPVDATVTVRGSRHVYGEKTKKSNFYFSNEYDGTNRYNYLSIIVPENAKGGALVEICNAGSAAPSVIHNKNMGDWLGRDDKNALISIVGGDEGRECNEGWIHNCTFTIGKDDMELEKDNQNDLEEENDYEEERE